MNRQNSNLKRSAASFVDRLSSRERLIVVAGLVFVFCFLVYEGVVDPFLSSKNGLERLIQNKRSDIVELKLLQQHYRQISVNKKNIIEQLRRRRPDFSLFSYVEQQIDNLRMKDRVVSIKPGTEAYQGGIRQAVIEISIDGIVLSQLVDFLDAIESFDEVVFIDRMVIRNDSEESGLLDIRLDIVTLEIEQQGSGSA
jgi:Tfp pilus assembly protein PilO